MDRSPVSRRRRDLLKGAGAATALSTLGFPAIVSGQSDAIRFGHLTPRTGFLGPLGEYAVMGVTLAVEEINAAGGVMGRKIELIAEDSVNPQTASTKAERLIERDKVAVIIGEISSASGLAIAQVAQRNRTLFFNTGCNSDELRGKACNRYMFHTEAANSMYVGAAGQALLRDGMVKGKKWYSLTADYAFGHDLLKVAKRFMSANGGTFAADELVPTDAADFSPFLLKIRNAKPDLVVSNLAGAQITNFMKQYLEFGLPFPVAGFGFDTAVAWGAGKGNVLGIWPLVWDSQVQTRVVETLHRRVHEEVRQAAGEPGVGRLHVDEARRAGDERDQVDRFDEDRRAPRKGREVRHHEDARRLLPQLGPPADAGDVHDHVQAGGRGQGQVGPLHDFGAGARRQPEPRGDRADARGEQLHDAGVIGRATGRAALATHGGPRLHCSMSVAGRRESSHRPCPAPHRAATGSR